MPGNILPESNAAPALQGKEKELAKHMRVNSLEKQLQNRPSPESLVKEGILTGMVGFSPMSRLPNEYAANENPLAET